AGVVVDHLTAAATQGWTRRPLVVDLCTGSGAIALAVATEVPCADVVAVELSEHALAWAGRNRDMHCPRVELRHGDATDPATCADVAGRVDVVVSNPPYIPPDAVPVDPEVRDHDPEIALYGRGHDGLDVPRKVIDVAAGLLRPGGLFVMEHAEVQSQALVRHLTQAGRWGDVQAGTDHAGRPRFVSATLLDS
ncbi:MAG: HemK/PrmC family methyltransferase, partial [Dermatophilus congolensis]|nr:HemK/PrmC family methyltransferase [Dermatophilus congolensis]